jgi:hypothetical protein
MSPQRQLLTQIFAKLNTEHELRKLSEAEADNKREENDDKKVSSKLRAFAADLIVSMPGLTEEKALQMFEHFSKQEKDTPMPQVDIQKLIPIIEEGLMARAKLTKRDGQSEAQAFARLYENDIEFRKSWAMITEMKHFAELSKSMPNMMSTTPTSTEVGNTNVSDDSAEAVRLLTEMAEKQHRTFTEVFLDAGNRELANRTYRSQQRPTASSTSGSELQRR